MHAWILLFSMLLLEQCTIFRGFRCCCSYLLVWLVQFVHPFAQATLYHSGHFFSRSQSFPTTNSTKNCIPNNISIWYINKNVCCRPHVLGVVRTFAHFSLHIQNRKTNFPRSFFRLSRVLSFSGCRLTSFRSLCFCGSFFARTALWRYFFCSHIHTRSAMCHIFFAYLFHHRHFLSFCLYAECLEVFVS